MLFLDLSIKNTGASENKVYMPDVSKVDRLSPSARWLDV